jgi:chromosome segregation ATPase
VTEVLPSQAGVEPENRSLSGEGLASTARISLVSKPPSLLSEHRALPALPRRTSPLPSLKTLFPYPALPRQVPPSETLSGKEEVKEETGIPSDDTMHAGAPISHEGEALAEVWQKMGQLNEELARAIQDRDQAVHEGAILREQLRQAEEALKSGEGPAASTEELALVARERDEAVAEAQALRVQLQGRPPVNKTDGFSKTKELTFLAGERDQARKEYAALRKEFETFKQEQSAPKEESGKFRKELEQQVEGFRQKLEERNREIAALKANSGGAAGGGGGSGDEKLKEEIVSLREQLSRAKDETSIAQRGLALSQKALHETRDTLREATEGTSLSRHNFDNLKNECATLAQQNTVLQAQNDQLSRELGAAKSKLTTRL